MLNRIFFWLILICFISGENLAQSGYELKISKILDGIYLFQPTTQCKDIVDGNVVAIIGKDRVWLIDTHQRGKFNRRLLSALDSITNLPVGYIVNTHWHGDHTFGNYAVRKKFPTAAIIAQTETEAEFDKRLFPTLREISSGYSDIIRMLETEIKNKKLMQGDTLTGYEMVRRKETLKDCYEIVEDYRNADSSLMRPTVSVSDTLRMFTGNEWMEIFHTPHAHSRGDLVIWLPSRKLLITGDLVVAPVPYAFNSNHENWQRILEWMVKLKPDLLIPGHGAVQKNLDYVSLLSQLLQETERQAKLHYKQGITLKDLLNRIDLNKFQQTFAGSDPETNHAFREYFIKPAIATHFKNLSTPSK